MMLAQAQQRVSQAWNDPNWTREETTVYAYEGLVNSDVIHFL